MESLIRVERGSLIFEEGERADHMYILKEGVVELTKRTAEGEARLKTITQANEYFGEMALVDGKPRSASARALERSTLIAVDGASFERLVASNGEFALKIIRTLSLRIRNSNEVIGEILETSPHERVAAGIAEYAGRHGEAASGGARYVRAGEMSCWLAGHVGAAREHIDTVVAGLLAGKRILRVPADKGSLIVTGDFMRERRRAARGNGAKRR